MLSYGANAELKQRSARSSAKVIMIAPCFVLRRLSHLPFHPGTR